MKPILRPGIRFLQVYFISGLILLGGGWFLYTRRLFSGLEEAAQFRSRLYAQYLQKLTVPDEGSTALDLIFSEVIQKIDFPVVVTDAQGRPYAYRNLDEPSPSEARLLEIARQLDKEYEPIPIQAHLDTGFVSLGWVHYGLSETAKALRLFPVYQLIGLVLFITIGVWAIILYRRAREEQIWTGLAKETAHQLGTPISSIAGWLEVLKTQRKDRVIPLLAEDMRRLTEVAERFSRIGMRPEVKPQRLGPVLEESFRYMKRRAPERIAMELSIEDDPVVPVDEVLISWTIENLLKNALDAVGESPGWIRVRSRLSGDGQSLLISVSDSGPGIKGRLERVFQPGFTTKRHGWGLGLTLARRIVEDYHRGGLEIKSSARLGTTFTLRLRLK